MNELDLVQQLPYLQNKMKRDREGYKKEYEMQLERFMSLVQIMEVSRFFSTEPCPSFWVADEAEFPRQSIS